jgi:two-component system sensor histidine kinase RpfC
VKPLFGAREAVGQAQVLDPAAIDELGALGGEAFVSDLIACYLEEAGAMLGQAREAVAAGDAQAFRDATHALRSSAANIGAARLAELCLAYQRIDPVTFAVRGGQSLSRLSRALDEVSLALTEATSARYAAGA